MSKIMRVRANGTRVLEVRPISRKRRRQLPSPNTRLTDESASKKTYELRELSDKVLNYVNSH